VTGEEQDMKIHVKADAIFDRAVDLCALLAVLLMAFVLAAVNSEIVMRYLLNSPMQWVTETTEYCILWMTFFAAAWVLKKEGHVVMDIALTRLKPGTRNRINLVTSLLGVVTCLVITWYGITVTLDLAQRGVLLPSALDPVAYPLYIIIPIGSLLLAVQFLRRSLGFWGSQKEASGGKRYSK